MGWETQLITLYLKICKYYREVLWVDCQRFTNGGKQQLSDEEVMTIYLFGVLKQVKSLKSIHRYATEHLSSWFPSLVGYAAFVHRVNRLASGFQGLLTQLQAEQVSVDDDAIYLADSFPIALANHQHAYRAKVAPELASKSYHSTKKMYYYGVKAHVLARQRRGTLPTIEYLLVEEAARQDGPTFDQIRPMLSDNLLIGDQAYRRPDADAIEKRQGLTVLTPIAKRRGQNKLSPQDRAFSKAVSRLRQPIETLFAWINRLTSVQNASLVRSSQGLLTHIFGKIAAAMIMVAFPEVDF